MSRDDASQHSEQYLKRMFMRLANELEQLEASGDVSERRYRRLLGDLFTVDKELQRRGLSWGY